MTAFIYEHVTSSFAYTVLKALLFRRLFVNKQMAASRFQTINTEHFLGQNENQNTLKKTPSHVTLL